MLSIRARQFRVVLTSILAAFVPTRTEMGLGRGRCFPRWAALPLLILLASGFLWAGIPSWATFDGLVTTLSTGSITMAGPEDVTVDSQGNIYIADPNNNQVVEVTAAGVSSVLTFPGLTPALQAPNAVAADESGNLFVADSNNNRIVKLAGGVASVVATGSVTLSYPTGVALDASGNLYIEDKVNNRIVEVTASGVASVLSISGLVTPLSAPNDLAVDVTGNLYIADSGNNRIVEVTPGGAGTVLSITGLSTGLSVPAGVAVDGSGNIYIADRGNNRIVTVTSGGVGAVLSTGSDTLHFPSGVAVDVSGIVYIADYGNDRIVEVATSVVGFGHVQVGASLGTTLTLPFTVGPTTTLGNVQALTLGTANLDFTVGAGTTCIVGTTDTTCSVNVQFLPTAAGLRKGAVVLYDNAVTPNLLATVPLYAIADAPLAALAPGLGSVIVTGNVVTTDPFQIALDGAGNMYVGNYTSSNVVKVAAGGGFASIISTGSLVPDLVTGVALDGAGNLFVADYGHGRILKVTPAGVASALTPTGLTLGHPEELALDTAGNLYIADTANSRVVRMTLAGVGSVVATGSYTPGGVTGVAVDAAGTVYITDDNNNRVIKVTAAGAASLVVPADITPVLKDPQGVAVDGFGNVYIVDSGNDRIVEVTTAGVASVLQTPGLPSPTLLGSPHGVTVDPSGNVFIPDWSNNRLVEMNVTASALSFPNTNVGSASSPLTATVTNLGDQPLVFAASPTYTANFSENTADENLCALSTSLLAGTVCDVSVEFTPQTTGTQSASIVTTTNNLNISNATQSIAVNGGGVTIPDTTALAVSANPAAVTVGQPLTLTATVTDTAEGHTATVPTGGVTFMDMVGSTAVSLNGGNAVPLNGAGMAILSGVTLSGAGAHTITASYAGVSNAFGASSNTTMLAVTTDTPTVAGPVTQPVQVGVGQASSVPITVTGPYSVVPVPTGSVTYNLLNSSNTSVASGTVPLTAGVTNSTATVPIASSLAAGSYTVSVNYSGDSNYAASVAPTVVQLLVAKAAPTIIWPQPAAITYGTSLNGDLDASAVSGVTPVAGSFTYTATPLGGTASAVTGATVLGGGSYTLTALFTPTDPTTYASASGSVPLTVTTAIPTIGLMSSASAALADSAVTLTATVASPISTPSGTVSFYDGSTLLGSGMLVLGVATYTTSSLPDGADSVTAVYSGDSNFSSVTSLAVTESVEDFAVAVATGSSNSATVSPGGTAAYALTIAPVDGLTFPSAITLTITGLPAGATATITPQTVAAGAGSTNVAVTIQVPAQTAMLGHSNMLALKLSPVMLGMLLLPFGGKIRRATGKHQRKLRLLLILLAATSVAGITGCGSGNNSSPQGKTYTMTMTATSGSLSHSIPLTLTVK